MTEREYELATLINKYQYEIAKLKEQLFAQPEQEQEPVVWQVIGIAGFMYVYNKPRDQVYEHHTVNALYLAPPKREPLSNVQLSKIWKEKYKTGFNAIEYYLFAELFRDAEKAHGITGGGE